MSKTNADSPKKYFTVAEANATLPLVRVIVKDITDLAARLNDRQERLVRLTRQDKGRLDEAYQEELDLLRDDLERAEEQMKDYVQELHALGVELKDYYTGLVDFPTLMEDREVYLCWKLDEPEVAHWHEIDAGFAGRQKLMANISTR